MKRPLIAAVVGLAAVAATATLSFGPSPAAGSSRERDVWRGQPVTSWAVGQRITHAHAPGALSLVSINKRAEIVDVGAVDFSVGDYIMLRLRLMDESGETHVGLGTVRCEFGFATQPCHGTFLIFKQGSIAIDGVIYADRDRVELSILGGTGRYKGVGGTARVIDAEEQSHIVLHFT